MLTRLDLAQFVERSAPLLPGERAVYVDGDAGWLNEGYFDMVARLETNVVELPEVALTDGEDTYDPAALFATDDILAIRTLHLTDPSLGTQVRTLAYINEEEFDQARSAGLAPTTPGAYTLVGWSLLRLAPAPSGTPTIGGTYVQRPLPVSLDAGTFTAIPAEYQKGIAYYALEQAAIYDNRPDDAATYRQRYEQMIDRADAAGNKRGKRRPQPMLPSRRMRTGPGKPWLRGWG